MSMTTLRAGSEPEILRVGERLPILRGQFLSGGDAELPRASSGQVAFVHQTSVFEPTGLFGQVYWYGLCRCTP